MKLYTGLLNRTDYEDVFKAHNLVIYSYSNYYYKWFLCQKQDVICDNIETLEQLNKALKKFNIQVKILDKYKDEIKSDFYYCL
jgi:CMP-2-keto-3-deoxyoctulosonic acid synthetase